MKNVCKKAAMGNMPVASFPLPPHFFPSNFTRLTDIFFQTLHIVHWSLKKSDFLMTVIYAEMLLRCRVWLQMCLCAVVMLNYWCGNLLTSFGEPSAKIVGMFSICFPDFLFCPDEVQHHFGWRWSFAFLLWFTRNYVLVSYQWHLSRNSYGLVVLFCLELVTLVFSPLSLSQLFFNVFQDEFLSWYLLWKTELAMVWI